MTAPDRIAEARRILIESGFPGTVTVRGDGAIAAVTVPREHWEEIAGPAGRALAGRLRALGFQFVAIDLGAAEHTYEGRSE